VDAAAQNEPAGQEVAEVEVQDEPAGQAAQEPAPALAA